MFQRKILLTAALALGCLLSVPAGSAEPATDEEIIRHFDSIVRVSKDGILDVNESIDMDFGSHMRHGLMRTIPVKYFTRHGTYRTSLRILGITIDGGSVPYQS
jgi:hypothetical protein